MLSRTGDFNRSQENLSLTEESIWDYICSLKINTNIAINKGNVHREYDPVSG